MTLCVDAVACLVCVAVKGTADCQAEVSMLDLTQSNIRRPEHPKAPTLLPGLPPAEDSMVEFDTTTVAGLHRPCPPCLPPLSSTHSSPSLCSLKACLTTQESPFLFCFWPSQHCCSSPPEVELGHRSSVVTHFDWRAQCPLTTSLWLTAPACPGLLLPWHSGGALSPKACTAPGEGLSGSLCALLRYVV